MFEISKFYANEHTNISRPNFNQPRNISNFVSEELFNQNLENDIEFNDENEYQDENEYFEPEQDFNTNNEHVETTENENFNIVEIPTSKH